MKVEIIGVGDVQPRGVEVAFATAYGAGKGTWIGPLPHVLSTYDVEFEVEVELILGDTILEVSSSDFVIDQDNDHVILQGQMEAVNAADGVCDLRIGDSIVLLQVTGNAPSPGSFVRVKSANILLYDTHI